jgi:hypothetical protein
MQHTSARVMRWIVCIIIKDLKVQRLYRLLEL